MDWIWSNFGCMPEEVHRIRETVFVQEQGFCEEFDDIDTACWHLLMVQDGKALGTARLFWEDKSDCMHIGRVAVLKPARGGGNGSAILQECCEKAVQFGAKHVVLGAQCRAVPFYQKNGFQPFGDIYDEEGCPHQMMEKKL